MSALPPTDAVRPQAVKSRGRVAQLRLLTEVRQQRVEAAAPLLAAQDRMVLLAGLAEVFGGWLPIESRWLRASVRLREDLQTLGIRLVRLKARRADAHVVAADLALGSEASRTLGRWLVELYGEGPNR